MKFVIIDLLKHRSKLLFCQGDIENGVSLISNSHSLGLRHKTLNIHHNLIGKKKEPNLSSLDMFDEVLDNQIDNQELENCLKFQNILAYPHWLKELPPEWTVVQITEVRRGKEMIKDLGGPPSLKSLPNLLIVRFPCGSDKKVLVTDELECPPRGIEGGGLLNELDAILEGNRRVNEDFRGNRDMYFKVKQEHHNQLKVM